MTTRDHPSRTQRIAGASAVTTDWLRLLLLLAQSIPEVKGAVDALVQRGAVTEEQVADARKDLDTWQPSFKHDGGTTPTPTPEPEPTPTPTPTPVPDPQPSQGVQYDTWVDDPGDAALKNGDHVYAFDTEANPESDNRNKVYIHEGGGLTFGFPGLGHLLRVVTK